MFHFWVRGWPLFLRKFFSLQRSSRASDHADKTNVVFENGEPIPYSLGSAPGGNLINRLVIGGLDGNAPTEITIEQLAPTGPEISVDVDAGVIYILGQTFVDSDPVSGLYRMNLDGSNFERILDAGSREEMVIDTADLDDTTNPVVTIFSPIGGTTNNQIVSLIGNITDDGVLDTISWAHDGEAQGAVSSFNGDFTVPSISLHPGDNLLEITATDLAGNSDSAQVSLNWQPLRELNLTAPESVREGRRSVTTVTLDSAGEVAGATFKLLYDAEDFEAPKYEFGEEVESASPVVNLSTPGEVSMTFAKAAGTIAAGEHELISVSLRARSVAVDGEAQLSIGLQDMADETGTPIVVGTYTDELEIGIIAREFNGDVNSNGRLDTGDASRMQALLTGISTKRPWDDLVNDLNGSTTLDSGDVIRTLRTVVGLEDQPSPPEADRGARSNTPVDPDAPRAILVLSQNTGAEGEKIDVRLQLENVGEAFSGASFVLEYPTDALRLGGAADHSPGAVVGGDAFLLWNLAPSQNDYANQSGTLTFGASSSSGWPGSSNGGTLANFSLTVAPGATAEAVWQIRVRDLEISTDSGFEIKPVAGASAAFLGQTQDFETWRIANFGAGQLADLSISGWGADPDGDRRDNAVEFFAGSDPQAVDVEELLAVGLEDHCLVATYTQAMDATGITATVQSSTDLTTWQDIDGGSSEIDFAKGTETTTIQLTTDGIRQYLRLKLSSEVQ